MPVRMELSRILIREMTDMQIIELSEVDGQRTFPIVIGLPEAFAIDRRLKGIHIPRPQTHDLLASVIEELGGELKQIVISDLIEGTFFAKLVIDQDGQTVEVDSRPSDAIALGVSQDVPIYVAEHVLEQASSDLIQELSAQSAAEFGVDEDEDDEIDDILGGMEFDDDDDEDER
jgi:bifunctional DNase/RNase